MHLQILTNVRGIKIKYKIHVLSVSFFRKSTPHVSLYCFPFFSFPVTLVLFAGHGMQWVITPNIKCWIIRYFHRQQNNFLFICSLDDDGGKSPCLLTANALCSVSLKKARWKFRCQLWEELCRALLLSPPFSFEDQVTLQWYHSK